MICNIKKTLYLLLFSVAVQNGAFADDFDGDALDDIVQIEAINVGETNFRFSIISSRTNKTYRYAMESFDPCNSLSLVKGKGTGEIVIDGSCGSRQGQIYTHLYEWSSERNNWILKKSINGEKADPISEVFTPTLHVSRVRCCAIMGDNNIPVNKAEEEIAKEISEELQYIDNMVKQKRFDDIVEYIDIYSVSEYANVLNDDNVELLNNLAFYIETKEPIYSAILLEKIVNEYPERMVAKLNLADVYWQLSANVDQPSVKSIALYKEYYDCMVARGLSDDIPERVLVRMKLTRY